MKHRKGTGYLFAAFLAGIVLYGISRYNYLIFHSLIELFSIIIAFSIFVIAWNTRIVAPNNYVLFLGISFFYVASIDLVHALAYKGVGVFGMTGSNLATQLWIAGRYLQSISLLAAPLFIGRKLRIVPVFALFTVCSIILLSSLYYGWFPDAFIEGSGLTPFKVASEYIISFLLALAIIALRKKREYFDRTVLNTLSWSIAATIASEMAFTLYTDVYGFFNALGHFFKIVSFYLFYVALVRTNLTRPYETMATEIEERKAAETALKERQEFITRLLDASPVAMIVSSGADERVILANRKFTELFGYTIEDMPDVAHWWPLAYPDPAVREKARAQWARSVEKAIRNRGEIEPIEAAVRCKDGSRRYIEFRFSSIGEWHLVTFTDLTERKQAEERERQLQRYLQMQIDRMPIGMIVWDKDFRVTQWNPAATKIFGFTEEEAMGKHPYDFIVPKEAQPAVDQIWARLLKGDRTAYSINENTTKDGQTIVCDWTNTPMEGAHGVTTSVLSMVQDITARKKAEDELRALNENLEERVNERTVDLHRKGDELLDSQRALVNIVEDLNLKTAELEQANSKLKELDRLKSMFIASMSHELRTPLNSIIGFSSILFDEWLGPLTTEQKENLAVIRRSGKHLLSLINDVIDVSKVEAGIIESHAEDFDLFDVITEAVTTFSQDVKEKGLELRVEAVHGQMHTDRRRLLQCVLNLISNAVKFTEKGEVTVQAGIRAREDGPGKDCAWAEVSVADTGIGIKEESMPKLCHAFVRIESPLKAKVPGTGLGLYLTKRLLAEVLKGEIICISRYEEGSRFTIKVPVKIE
jgi:PAS domain S-box-containing protein